MTQDEIIEMVGLAFGRWPVDMNLNDIKAFAKLVAEKEREACALICDEFPDVGLIRKKITSEYHAYLIRARGQA